MLPPRFAVLSISHEITETGVIIKAATDVPCHLWLRHTTTKPRIHLDPVLKRGLATHAEPRFCFVVPEDDEQEEPDDTPEHTIPQPDWPVCQTRYFYFWGTINGQPSPSESAIFDFHRTQPPITQTFNPDADPESTSVDGYMFYFEGGLFGGLTWAELIVAVGNNSNDNGNWAYGMNINSSATRSKWKGIGRSILLFDTFEIPLGATILSATLSLFGESKADALLIQPDINVYSSNPASNTGLINKDLNTLGIIPFCDTPITYNGWSLVSYNDFILNADGLAAITKGGITKLGLRNANYDVAEVPPNWRSFRKSNVTFYTAEYNTPPKLVVTYTV